MNKLTIKRQEASQFATVWTRNGIVLPLNSAAIDFATDFANVVLSNFISMCERQANAAKQAAAAKALVAV